MEGAEVFEVGPGLVCGGSRELGLDLALPLSSLVVLHERGEKETGEIYNGGEAREGNASLTHVREDGRHVLLTCESERGEESRYGKIFDLIR